LEGLDDAGTELMMMEGDTHDEDDASPGILVWIGEAFFEVTEEEATAHCEMLVEKFQSQLDALASEQESIQKRQDELKTILYGRFGKSINLEDEPQSS
jgi:prefoldin subunit 4